MYSNTRQRPDWSVLLISLLIALIPMIGLLGCVTTSTTPPDKAAAYALLLQASTTGTAIAVLHNNPTLGPVGVDLVQAADDVLASKKTLDVAAIDAFVQQLAVKRGLKASEVLEFTALAQIAYQGFVQVTGKQIVLTTDPQARQFVLAFRNGLAAAVGLPVVLDKA